MGVTPFYLFVSGSEGNGSRSAGRMPSLRSNSLFGHPPLPQRPHACAVTSIPTGSKPPRRNTRTDSAAVAPVVTMSSTTSTCRVRGTPPSSSRIRPARLRRRSAADKPTESRTPRAETRSGCTNRCGSWLAATCAARETGSPPRARAARARVGAGTTVVGPGGSSPHRRRRDTATAQASPRGSARSRRPRSFAATTARLRGPAYGPRLHTGTPGSPRSRTSAGGSFSTRAHARHHAVPLAPHPPHARGSTRSKRDDSIPAV